MPDITVAKEYTKADPGFQFLAQTNQAQGLIFSGTTLATTVEVGCYNDVGTFVPFEGGVVTSLPTSMRVSAVPGAGLVINVTGGSPNFNVSSAGPAGPLGK